MKNFSAAPSSLRKPAPKPPHTNPSSTNHGSCDSRVKSNGGTTYHASMPKKLRDTTAAMTDANTSGTKTFIEKLPSTIVAANNAPPTGAL